MLYTMMDSIRRQQIAEVLNYDRNVKLQVMNLEKKGVEKMGETGALSSLQTQHVLDDTTELINSLKIILDKKRAGVLSLPHFTAAHGKQHTDAIDDLTNIHEVVDAYNVIVASYLGNNTVQTKQMLHACIRRLLSDVAPITRGLSSMLQTYADNRRAQGVNIRRYFAKLLVALSAYSLIEDQLRSGSLYNVSTSALQERLNALLAAHRTWGAIFR